MVINANTRIAKILKHSEAALEAIISLTPKFEKLRNPFLRKLMAGRTSIAMAAKIGGCSVHDFFQKLQPLGFETDEQQAARETLDGDEKPAFMNELKAADILSLDVRPVIEAGKDPLTIILEKVAQIEPGKALKIINSFEPTPLIGLLGKKGFKSYISTPANNVVESFFYLPQRLTPQPMQAVSAPTEDWDGILQKFEGRLETTDVRELEMPGPMLTILSLLETLEPSKALYVVHKRIPVFLIPELKEKGWDLRAKTIDENRVDLLIFKHSCSEE